MDKQHLLLRKNDIENKIITLKKKLSLLPDGELHISKCHNTYKWYDFSNNKRNYISKKNLDFAQKLAQKQVIQSHIHDLENESKAITSYLKIYDTDNLKLTKLQKNPEINRLLKIPSVSLSEELSNWANQPYNSNPAYPEKLVHRGISGKMYRSKSETIIDMLLFQANLPYRNECELIMPSKSIYPDFTIRHPVSGAFFYWEHCGRMDDSAYVDSFINKINNYFNIGVFPSQNLILTFETELSPLSPAEVQFYIEKYFL